MDPNSNEYATCVICGQPGAGQLPVPDDTRTGAHRPDAAVCFAHLTLARNGALTLGYCYFGNHPGRLHSACHRHKATFR